MSKLTNKTLTSDAIVRAMYTRALLVAVLTVCGCGGDDSSRTPPDGPKGSDSSTPAVSLTLSPSSVRIAAGQTLTVTATIVRTSFTGPVVIATSGATADVAVTGGTIAEGETTTAITLVAAGNSLAHEFDLTATATAEGLTIDPAALAVTVAGQLGASITGEATGDQCGSAVALSANGKRIVVGSPINDASGTEAGSARVFDRTTTGGEVTWTQVGSDIDGIAAGDHYGGAVAISDDGSRVAIGSYLNSGNGTTSGVVRVFDLVGTTWTQRGADLHGPAGSGHGWVVALSASGSRLVVGAPAQNSTDGRAYMYEYNGTAWTQLGATLMGDLELGDSVTMSGDGKRVAIGSPSAAGLGLPGTVQVFEYVGGAWTQVGADLLGEGMADLFGDAVALSSDGNTLAVGASSNDGGGLNAGSVRVFRFAAGAWTQLGGDLDGTTGFEVGSTISLSGDGTRVMSGGPSNGGVAQLFTFSNGAWTLSPGPDFGTTERTGTAVAISRDGLTGAVGVIASLLPGPGAGSVRIYELP